MRRSESLGVCVGDEPEGGRGRELIPLNVSHRIRIVDYATAAEIKRARDFGNFSFSLNHKFMLRTTRVYPRYLGRARFTLLWKYHLRAIL